MKAMILAAGRGNRLRPFTDSTPKPLLKVDEFSLIEHLLFHLSAQGFKEIVINVAYLGRQIQETLGNGARYQVNIEYSVEEEEGGLETGGGIYKALPLLGPEPFLVVSGDIWTHFQFSTLRTKSLKGLAHLILVDNLKEHKEGDFNFIDGQVVPGKGEKKTFASIGVYHPSLFAECQPGYFPLAPLLHKAAQQGLLTAEYYFGEWVNVGTPEILKALREKLA